MDTASVCEELAEILTLQNIEIRREGLGGVGSGLCTIQKRNVLFLDIDSTSREQARALAEAVCRFVDIETIYLRPSIRAFIYELFPDQKNSFY
mgnify:CR=1 FL=1